MVYLNVELVFWWANIVPLNAIGVPFVLQTLRCETAVNDFPRNILALGTVEPRSRSVERDIV